STETEGADRGKYLIQAEAQGTPNQQWLFVPSGRGPDSILIQNRRSGLLVNISGSLKEGAVMSLWGHDAGTHNVWVPTKAGIGYTFRSTDSHFYLTASANNAGAQIVQKPMSNGDEQVWESRPLHKLNPKPLKAPFTAAEARAAQQAWAQYLGTKVE